MAGAPKSDWDKIRGMFLSFDYDEWLEQLGGHGGFGVSRLLFLSILYIGMWSILNIQIPNLLLLTFSWIVGTSPIWMPIALIVGAYHVWVWYARSNFIYKQKFTLLEMKIPREIFKSPRAMETVLTNLWIPSRETHIIMRIIQGTMRPWYSLEIASLGGEIHFYIWVPELWRKGIEATIYAEYPEIELHEAEDYAQKYTYDPKTQTVYICDWRLEPFTHDEAGCPNRDAYPMKSYLDFELEQDPKEEYKVDPLTTVLELLSSMKREQQLWVQIGITPAWRTGVLIRKDHMWKHIVEQEVEKVRLESVTLPEGSALAHISGERLRSARPRATWKQTQQIETMERHLGKHPFEVVIRGVYISPTKDYGWRFWDMRLMWRPWANQQYMSQLRNRRWHEMFDWPWMDWHDFRWDQQTLRGLDAYRRRSFFYPPWETPTNVMTTELIASIWHPVSSTAKAPGLNRMPATKSAPPQNLPM